MTTKKETEQLESGNPLWEGGALTPQQQQIYHAFKLLGTRIDKFSGSEEKTFEEFLEEYSELTQRFQIPRAVAKSLLPIYLTGMAKLKFQSIENRDQMNWEQLVTTLASKLKNQATLSNIRDELHNISQGKDSVGEFARKVLTKTRFAFQGQGDRVINQMAIDFFIKGLNPELRKVIRRLPETEDFETVVLNVVLMDEKVDRLKRQLKDMQLNGNQQRPRPRSSQPLEQQPPYWQQPRPQSYQQPQPYPPTQATYSSRPGARCGSNRIYYDYLIYDAYSYYPHCDHLIYDVYDAHSYYPHYEYLVYDAYSYHSHYDHLIYDVYDAYSYYSHYDHLIYDVYDAHSYYPHYNYLNYDACSHHPYYHHFTHNDYYCSNHYSPFCQRHHEQTSASQS
ncbi:unnamed protein product [Heligmosomoides polygyrus]|uniref:Retrotrans_gag domain-containing protein n=1 Tax=Heligmosomoides polygyrus TaxID=6339 RepID=A0A183FRC5_HELPZ|nr:unnamed protein product [Heligmosomoides polygyrus]